MQALAELVVSFFIGTRTGQVIGLLLVAAILLLTLGHTVGLFG